MELKKDEIKVVMVENKVQVTREIIEEFDAAEYLRRLQQLDQNKENTTSQLTEMEKMIGSYGAMKEEAIKIAEEEAAAAIKEREAAAAKEAAAREEAEDGNPN